MARHAFPSFALSLSKGRTSSPGRG